MGRKPRVEYDGGIYHVIQRGNNREAIFKDNEDKNCLLEDLRELRVAMGYRVFGFTLMENHYHLVLQTLDKPLQSVMQRINCRYSKYYNKKYGHYGHVFAARYKAIPVSDDKYLLTLIRYVHQNPVKAGLCSKAEDYRWSSDFFYRTNTRDWIDIGLVLGMLSAESPTAVRRYRVFMAEEEKENFENYRIVGQSIAPRDRCKTFQAKAIYSDRKSLDEILQGTGVNEKNFELIKRGSRQRNLTGYKLLYVEEALQARHTMKEIGDNIRISGVAILDLTKKYNLKT